MNEPPDFTNATFDFSEFHPLDHWPWTPYCRSLPGGVRDHLSLAWDYRWSTRLASWTLCRMGRHRPVEGWKRSGEEYVAFTSCVNCGEEM